MQKIIIVGLGGFTGAILRYALSAILQNTTKNTSFPYSTLVINLLGCFLMGALSQCVESMGLISQDSHAFLIIGLLGAFTTFSTFSNESFVLMRVGKTLFSFLNISLHIILGLGAIWLGRLVVLFFRQQG